MTKQNFRNINSIFFCIEEKIKSDINQSAYNYTFLSMYYNTIKINEISNSMLKCINDRYTNLILYRSLIEHFLVMFYIYLRWKIEMDDSVGEEYYHDYANSEIFKQEMYFLQLEDYKNNTKEASLETLKENNNLNNLTQLDLDKYHTVANKFSNVKKIGDYLIKNKNNEPFLNSLSEEIFKLLYKYNVLSSYVHGGPYAERQHFGNANDNNDAHLEEWIYTMAGISKCLLVLSLSFIKSEYKISFQRMYKNE